MIHVDNLSLAFGGRPLFENVDIKFTPGNCYGLIGANGAGKSTFLRCLSGKVDGYSGNVGIADGLRLSVLEQDHFAYNEVSALETVIMGHARLHEIIKLKDELYAKPDFSDEDGITVGNLESEFAELNGWTAEAEAAQLLSSLGIPEAHHGELMKDLEDSEKVRVLLARAVFGEPDILLLDEPTNHLDVDSILWLEEFLYNFKSTVIVVSHDRHFLDRVCTHIADVDFQKVSLFTGNYTFWYQTSQMALRQKQNANKRKTEKIKELQAFIQRFSANASKSKQATSRKALLDKITLDDIKPSSRKYPYIVFETERRLGKDVLHIEGLSKTIDGEVLFKDLMMSIPKGEKVAITGNDLATSTFLAILAGEMEPDEGTVRWGRSVNLGYLPKEYGEFFETDMNLVSWMQQFSTNQEENFVRSFLGRMLFKGDEATHKSARVLSGGEKVRCMLARMMLQDPNVLLLDGPTNHLDLESIQALNNAIEKFEGTVVLSTHDVQFADSLVTRVIEFAGETHYDLNMGYEQYLADPDRRARVAASKG
ncbi:MAG: hypothetical protein CMN30_20025 [Sandaracinus sp.]|nr:hypothetical protein [Sandaracinus sp.]